MQQFFDNHRKRPGLHAVTVTLGWQFEWFSQWHEKEPRYRAVAASCRKEIHLGAAALAHQMVPLHCVCYVCYFGLLWNTVLARIS